MVITGVTPRGSGLRINIDEKLIALYSGRAPNDPNRTDSPTSEELDIDKDKVRATAKGIGAKIREEAGKLVDSAQQGLKAQAEEKVEQFVGKVKETVKGAIKP